MVKNDKNRIFIHISLELGEIKQIEVIHKLQSFNYEVVLAVFMS